MAVVDFPTPISPEEQVRRLKVEVDRLSRLPAVEWMLYLDSAAEKHGVKSAKLRTMIEGTINIIYMFLL